MSENLRKYYIDRLTKLIQYLNKLSQHASDGLKQAPKQYETVVTIMHECGFRQFAVHAQLKVSLLRELPFNKATIQIMKKHNPKLAKSMQKADHDYLAKSKQSVDFVEIKDKNGGDISGNGQHLRPITSEDIRNLIKSAIYYVHYVYPTAKLSQQNGKMYVSYPKTDLRAFACYQMIMAQTRYVKAC